MPAPETAWTFYRQKLLEHYRQDPEGHKHPWRWSTVVATMYVGPGLIVTGEVAQMQEAGVPIPDWQDEDVTNLLHQRYHFWQWEQAHPAYSIADLRSIVEFGSGYGAMALVAHRLGFRGTYWLVDFPEFTEIAVRHLKHRAAGLNVKVGHAERPDLLVSIFGLSEASLEDRGAFMARVAPKTYLFGMQGQWGGIENLPWFTGWAQGYGSNGGPLWKVVHQPHKTIYLTSYWSGR